MHVTLKFEVNFVGVVRKIHVHASGGGNLTYREEYEVYEGEETRHACEIRGTVAEIDAQNAGDVVRVKLVLVPEEPASHGGVESSVSFDVPRAFMESTEQRVIVSADAMFDGGWNSYSSAYSYVEVCMDHEFKDTILAKLALRS